MTSVGYGDFFPTTHIGRIICYFSVGLGGVIFGFIIFAFTSYVLITNDEERVLMAIDKTRAYGNVVKQALIYNHYLNLYHKFDGSCVSQKKKLFTSISNVKKKNYVKKKISMKKGIKKYLNTKLLRIEEKLDNAGLRIN